MLGRGWGEGEGRQGASIISSPSLAAGASQAVLPEHKADANVARCVQDRSGEGGSQDERGPRLVGLPHNQELGLHSQNLPAGERQLRVAGNTHSVCYCW